MTIFLVAPGVVLGIGGGKRALWAPLPTSSSGGGAGTTPTSVPGIAGYWDASTTANLITASGTSVAGWNLGVSSIADLSGNSRPLAVYSQAASPVAPLATPRLNGLLGGVGRNTFPPSSVSAANYVPSGQYLPIMDPDQGFQLPAVNFSTGSDWSIYLVWSRPNFRQGGTGSTAPVALITIGGVPVVTLGSTASAASLTLFPTGANVALSAGMTRRHTHSLILSYSHTAGMTAYLDGSATPVASGVSAAPINAGGLLTLLHDTTAGGGAQCWFHELAYWTRSLSGGDITTLEAAASRWTRGSRRGINILVNGQSNAVYGYTDSAWHQMAQGVAWYLGALAGNVLGTPSTTLVGGEGLYQATGDPFSGSFLADPNNGSAPSTWSLGSDGTTAQSYVTGLPAAELSDVAAIFWPWSESDSGKSYSEKATFEAAQQRYIALMRGWTGKSASALPWLLWNAIPFQYFTPEPGNQMIREVCYDQTQASGQNAWIVLPQTSDSISRSAIGNSDGTWTDANTDAIHHSASDNVRFGQRAAIVAARAILASSGGDTITSFPAGMPAVGGPVIRHVYQQSATVYIVTVTHDAGSDLILPQQAANGFGWSLMDGGSVASLGTLILATSCVYVSSTKIQVTFASAPAHAVGSLLLFYPYGGMNMGNNSGASAIGRGLVGTTNAVTDNLATLTPPAGWDIGNQLGTSWFQNLPLAATTYGIPVSATP